MGALLRSLGLLLGVVWVAMLLLGEKFDQPLFTQSNLVAAGAALLLLGSVVVGMLGRARGAVVRRRCMRCGRRVTPGEAYCTEHFRETVNRARDHQPG